MAKKATETNILSQLLAKRGIKDISELSQEERGVFEQWRKTLLTETMTIEEVLNFCEVQISVIENQFKDLENTPEKAIKLTLLHDVYKSLFKLIRSPQETKEQLIKHLTNQL